MNELTEERYPARRGRDLKSRTHDAVGAVVRRLAWILQADNLSGYPERLRHCA